ncbi:FecR domain-containing protein [Actomonas aquatica]|uniref:FecR domain-containing protein n=1 Tax=Actomonas aquatica TaxID=2866162 RepID=A0ABZ1C8E1_9BACT|nr:FecR domain-containing protein [Opitutus sp. WL0086]WRQ87692.1 FecR domain-containing protein [Opitutus sp. WL0086]
MKLRALTLLLAAVVVATSLSAQTAKIIRMTGEQAAQVTKADGTTVPLTLNQELAENDLIEVMAGTRVFMRTFAGTITVIEENSILLIEEVRQVGERERTLLDLKQGNVVANLDPDKRSTNDYGVKTPRGVAAARGTNYTVTVDGMDVLVTVTNGTVELSFPELPTPIMIEPGNVSTGTAAQSLSSAMSDPATAAKAAVAMRAAATAVASLINEPNSGVTSATLNQLITVAATASNETGDNGSLVAGVAAAATAANPSVAEEVVQSAVSAVANSGNASAVATNVVASVTRAATRATPGSSVADTAASLSAAANNASGGTVTVDSDTVTDAVNESVDAPEVPDDDAGSTPTADEGNEGADDGPEIDETEVEIEVPNDNVIVSPST